MPADFAGLRAMLEALGPRAQAQLETLLDERAAQAEESLRDATPIRTGATASSWDTEAPEPLVRIVSNASTTPKNFLVASALITGTGSRGVPTTGYSGAFTLGWPGMAPRQPLHDVWETETHTPLGGWGTATGTIDLTRP
jgi:hypothetical protein